MSVNTDLIKPFTTNLVAQSERFTLLKQQRHYQRTLHDCSKQIDSLQRERIPGLNRVIELEMFELEIDPNKRDAVIQKIADFKKDIEESKEKIESFREKINEVKKHESEITSLLEKKYCTYHDQNPEAQHIITLIKGFVDDQKNITTNIYKHSYKIDKKFPTNDVINCFRESLYSNCESICHLTALVFVEYLKDSQMIQNSPDLSLRNLQEIGFNSEAARQAVMTPFSVTRLLYRRRIGCYSHEFVIVNLGHPIFFIQSNIYGGLTLKKPGGIIELEPTEAEKLFDNNLEVLADLFGMQEEELHLTHILALDSYRINRKAAE